MLPISTLLPILAVALFAAWGVQSFMERRRRLPSGLLQAELAACAIALIAFTPLLRGHGPVVLWTAIVAAVILLANGLITFARGLRDTPPH